MEVDRQTLKTINEKFYNAQFDYYLIRNHEELFNLFSLLESYTDWCNYSGLNPLTSRVSRKNTLNLANSFLTSLSPDYRKKIWYDFFRFRLIGRKNYTETEGEFHRNFLLGIYWIFYPKNRNIGDLLALIHEYIHCISANYFKTYKSTSSYKVYCELLSILGELKLLDFLLKNDFPEEEIKLYKDYIRQSYQHNINGFLFSEPILDLHIKGESLTEETLAKIMSDNPFYKLIGEHGVMQNLRVLENDDLKSSLSYIHPLGLAHASSLYKNGITDQEFVELIEAINQIEIEEFEELLPKRSNEELARDTADVFSFQRK